MHPRFNLSRGGNEYECSRKQGRFYTKGFFGIVPERRTAGNYSGPEVGLEEVRGSDARRRARFSLEARFWTARRSAEGLPLLRHRTGLPLPLEIDSLIYSFSNQKQSMSSTTAFRILRRRLYRCCSVHMNLMYESLSRSCLPVFIDVESLAVCHLLTRFLSSAFRTRPLSIFFAADSRSGSRAHISGRPAVLKGNHRIETGQPAYSATVFDLDKPSGPWYRHHAFRR